MTSLNTGQQAAADAFAQFLFADEEFFLISGSAGVGKTFLMDYLSNTAMQTYFSTCKITGTEPQFSSVAFTATTNKAAEILENSIGKPVTTIHSFLGLKMKENYSSGKTTITKSRNWKVLENLIIFIDECSMIDSSLLKFILESTKNCKVVFVGDHSQLAPVNENISPIYAKISQANMCRLYEPVRNAGSTALIDLCDQLRETVRTGIFSPIQEVPGVVDFFDDDEMQQEIDACFKDLDPSARVLCYTNERVNEFNMHIRENVRNIQDPIVPGDKLVVGRAYMMM